MLIDYLGIAFLFFPGLLHMAAVSIPPSPQAFPGMSSRRVPLAHLPNAANSPFRAVAAAAQKRSRSHSSVQRELTYGQPPPAKKQMLERDESNLRSPPRGTLAQDPEAKGLAAKAAAAPSAFQKKLAVARERKETREHLQNWQKHYRKVFPNYVFFMESMAQDTHKTIVRQLRELGSVSQWFLI